MTNPYFWEGTKVVKSLDNDFNWRARLTEGMQDYMRHLRQSQAGKTNAKIRSKVGIEKGEPYYITPSEKPYQKSFTTYSKAVPSRKTK